MSITVDYGDLKAYLDGMIHNYLPKVTAEMNKAAIHSLKSRIISNINARKRPDHAGGHGHNTPIPLQRLLHVQIVRDNYNVPSSSIFFDRSQNIDLAAAVEMGTKPHPQENNYLMAVTRGGQHPGAKPMWFFRDAVAGFINEELKYLVQKGADDLVDR